MSSTPELTAVGFAVRLASICCLTAPLHLCWRALWSSHPPLGPGSRITILRSWHGVLSMCHRSPPYPPPPASPLPGYGFGWQWLKFYLNQTECLGQSRNSRNICEKEWNSNGENWTFNKWVCSSSKHCWVRADTSMVGIRKWQVGARLFSAASPRRDCSGVMVGEKSQRA